MKCSHQFIHITDTDKAEMSDNRVNRRIPGAVIGCAVCGTIVRLFEDGELRK